MLPCNGGSVARHAAQGEGGEGALVRCLARAQGGHEVPATQNCSSEASGRANGGVGCVFCVGLTGDPSCHPTKNNLAGNEAGLAKQADTVGGCRPTGSVQASKAVLDEWVSAEGGAIQAWKVGEAPASVPVAHTSSASVFRLCGAAGGGVEGRDSVPDKRLLICNNLLNRTSWSDHVSCAALAHGSSWTDPRVVAWSGVNFERLLANSLRRGLHLAGHVGVSPCRVIRRDCCAGGSYPRGGRVGDAHRTTAVVSRDQSSARGLPQPMDGKPYRGEGLQSTQVLIYRRTSDFGFCHAGADAQRC